MYNNVNNMNGLKNPPKFLEKYSKINHFKHNGEKVKYPQMTCYDGKFNLTEYNGTDYCTCKKIKLPKLYDLDKNVKQNKCAQIHNAENTPLAIKPSNKIRYYDEPHSNMYVKEKIIPSKFYLPNMSGPLIPKPFNYYS